MTSSHPSSFSSAARSQLEQLQVAYQQAVETAYFKAGFLARTAHELRSPLNHIISLNQLILNDLCDDPAEEREMVAQANAGALKLLQLLDQLIQVSKLEIGRVEPQLEAMSVTHLWQQVQEKVQLQVRDRGMQLRIHWPHPDVQILTDCRWLTQVWISLIESAVETTQTGAIQLGVNLAGKADQVCLWLQDGRSPADWSELVEQLQNPADLSPPVSIATPPSAGLRLLIAQSTLAAMDAELAVQPVESANDKSQLACLVPRA
ncbi:sensor histidine kinase [Sphaerothrix gracilis]|uniref:sensor histidine kinase n=1 Tax=Sphaerothrix gracilis TaxID=3151835 RepID=UPI0031FCADFA